MDCCNSHDNEDKTKPEDTLVSKKQKKSFGIHWVCAAVIAVVVLYLLVKILKF